MELHCVQKRKVSLARFHLAQPSNMFLPLLSILFERASEICFIKWPLTKTAYSRCKASGFLLSGWTDPDTSSLMKNRVLVMSHGIWAFKALCGLSHENLCQLECKLACKKRIIVRKKILWSSPIKKWPVHCWACYSIFIVW